MRAMRGENPRNRTISTVLCVHWGSFLKVLSSEYCQATRAMRAKRAVNRTLATVLCVPLNILCISLVLGMLLSPIALPPRTCRPSYLRQPGSCAGIAPTRADKYLRIMSEYFSACVFRVGLATKQAAEPYSDNLLNRTWNVLGKRHSLRRALRRLLCWLGSQLGIHKMGLWLLGTVHETVLGHLLIFKNLLMPLFFMGCFPGDFREGKRPIKAFGETAHWGRKTAH